MANAPAPAAQAKKKGKLALLVLPLLAAVAGAATPVVVDVPALLGAKTGDNHEDDGHKKKKNEHANPEHLASVSIGDVFVNLNDERMNRFLKVKVALQCDHAYESTLHELVEKNKAALKSWMIGHLTGKSIRDVIGQVAIRRTQREMLEQFEAMLFPEGDSPLRAVLFEEYVIQ